MLPTVATQNPRNSRAGSGGPCSKLLGWLDTTFGDVSANAEAAVKNVRRCMMSYYNRLS